MQPTIEEKYQHMRDNAEAFVESMRAMIGLAARKGDLELESQLRVWCLNPWEAALRDDDAGDLWPTCEACGEPIKTEADRVSSDECSFHRSCVDQ